MEKQYQQEFDLACKAAKAAGALLKELMAGDIKILSQIDRDIKIQADRDAEAAILAILAESAYPVLAEESGEHGVVGGESPYWIVDPLDGTLNFSRGLPICCVSIALSLGKQPVLGVIYDSNRDELFTGFMAGGAWCNGREISVSNTDAADQAILSTGLPTKRSFDDASLQHYVQEIQRFKKVRMLGSAALMLAYVASGRVDAYSEDDIMFWDVAAGVAIIGGAGGFIHLAESPRVNWGRVVRCGGKANLWPNHESTRV